ncbi:MAG TPA: hypothetical protein DCF33_17540 [Saprospirales bacterium]|nr:hypothetical protein [Saprospirales bacterium]
MNHNDEIQIQDYAAGLLSGSKKAEFERRLQAEPDLRTELDLYVAMMALDQQRLKKSLLGSLEHHETQPIKPGASGKWIWGAGGLAVLILIGAWYALQSKPQTPAQPATAQEIALTFIREAYPPPVVSMGSNDTLQAMQQKAYLAYRNKQFAEAANLLKPLADQPGAPDELLFYAGESCLQTDQWNEAITYFGQVGAGYWHDKAEWRLALGLLQSGKPDSAIPLLEKMRLGDRKNEAEKLLKALQDFN